MLATHLGSSMTFIDGTVVNVALPVLRKQLAASAAEAQWIVEAHMLFRASLMLVGLPSATAGEGDVCSWPAR